MITHERIHPVRRTGGFTLPELVTTMVIAAVLAVVAVPSFSGLIAGERGRSTASALFASLATARSEAITLNRQVALSPQNGSWVNGWATTYTNGSGTSVTVDTRGATPGNNIRVSGPSDVVYYPSGHLSTGSQPMFVIQILGSGSTSYQCVSVDPSGTPYMRAASTC